MTRTAAVRTSTQQPVSDDTKVPHQLERPATKKMALVGCKTLSAMIVKKDDPIVRGEVLELSGRALEYAETKLYQDELGNVHNMFEPADSAVARRVIAEVTGIPEPMDEERAASRRRTRAALV